MKRTVFRLVTLAALLVLLLPGGSLVADSRSAEGSAPAASAPLSVADLTVAASEHDLLLTWTHLGSEIDHYEVHRSRAPHFAPDAASFVENVYPGGGATLEYPDAGRAYTANYFYAVVPVEAGGVAQGPRIGSASSTTTCPAAHAIQRPAPACSLTRSCFRRPQVGMNGSS